MLGLLPGVDPIVAMHQNTEWGEYIIFRFHYGDEKYRENVFIISSAGKSTSGVGLIRR